MIALVRLSSSICWLIIFIDKRHCNKKTPCLRAARRIESVYTNSHGARVTMAWNNQEGKDKDKWGQGRDNEGPPDLDELFRRMKRRFGKFANSNGKGGSAGSSSSGFWGAGVVFIAIAVVWLLSGIYIVRPPERAVVLRFGEYVRTEMPGPHWLPRFIESNYIVNVEETSSWKYTGEMLTKDENIASVELSVFFRIEDPKKFLFQVVNPLESLSEATTSSLRQVVGSSSLDEILTSNREKVRKLAFDNLVAIIARYNTGLEIVNVNLQDVRPPAQVIDAFDDVNKAREDKDSIINTANAYERKVEENVKGQVKQIIRKAEADKSQMVAYAKAGVASYLALLPEYKRAPSVTRERLYLETLESILSKSSKVLIDSQKGSNNMMYLPLDKMINMQQKNKDALKNEAAELSTSDDTASEISTLPRSSRSSIIQRPSYRDYNTRRGS